MLIGAGAGLGIAIFRCLLDGLFGLTIDGLARNHPLALIRLPALGGLLVAGAVVIQSLLGSSPAFSVPAYELLSPGELGLWAVLGVAAAVVAFFYIRILDRLEHFFDAWRIPNWVKPALGALSYFFRAEILGTSYPAIGEVLSGKLNGPLILFTLVRLKPLATP